MFHSETTRPSARHPSSRPSADPQTVTADACESAILGFQALEDVDTRFAEFLDHAEFSLGHSLDTRRGYKGTYGNFRQFLAARPENVLLAQRLLDIQGWVAWNRKRASEAATPLSSVTVNTYFRQLRPFFKDLAERDGIANPFDTVAAPRLPRVRLPKARTFEECQLILATAEHFDWPSSYERARALAILAIFLYAGLRKREVLRLKFAHVNLTTSKIFIEDGKGETDRVIDIAPELRTILGRYVSERRHVFTEKNPAGPAFFTSTQTGQGISEASLRRMVAKVRRASGIRFSMHSLRHSFITVVLNNDSGIHVAQRLAGHKKITTTAMYIGLNDKDLRREMQKVSFRTRRFT